MSDVAAVNGKSKWAPVPGRIPGRLINMGGHDLVFAPLNLDQVQYFDGEVEKFGQAGAKAATQLEQTLPLLLASLQRNYPDMTEADLRPLVDMGNFAEAMEAVVSMSGYAKTLPGEARPASP